MVSCNFLRYYSYFFSTAAAVGLDTVHLQSLSGDQIDQMNDQQLEQIIKSVSVFYRVTPKHKLCIVKARYKYHFAVMYFVEIFVRLNAY